MTLSIPLYGRLRKIFGLIYIAAMAAACGLLALPALGGPDGGRLPGTILLMEDGQRIVMSGLVGDVRYDSFDLLIGQGREIRVEAEEMGFDDDLGRFLTPGQNVTVAGRYDGSNYDDLIAEKIINNQADVGVMLDMEETYGINDDVYINPYPNR